MGAPMIHGYNALVRLPMMDGKFDASSQKAWIKALKRWENLGGIQTI